MNKMALFSILLVAALAVLIAGCTQQQVPASAYQPAPVAAADPSATAPADTVKLMTTKLGGVLADARDMTLYYFITDTPGSGTSTCYAAANCTHFWPIFSAPGIVVSPPLAAADFSSITRTDGTTQTTYKGWPLYYFLNDKNPGNTNGEGVLKTWYVARPDYTIMLAQQPGTGTFLTDGRGKTLYYFAKDAPGTTSSCTGSCLAKWPPFNAGPVVAPSALKSTDFATAARTDGVTQTMYMNRLLYYYAGDAVPGDVNGQGFLNIWYVANITGYAPPVPVPTPTPVPTTSAYGFGSSGSSASYGGSSSGSSGGSSMDSGGSSDGGGGGGY